MIEIIEKLNATTIFIILFFFTCFFLNYSFVFDFFSEHKLEKYNARPNECIVFEDSLHGVMASKAAGFIQ